MKSQGWSRQLPTVFVGTASLCLTYTMKYSSAKSPKRAAGLTNATTVLDPLCGVATILIEGKREWPNAVFYGGDIDTTQIDRAVMNVKRSGVDPGDLFIWDCARKY